MVKIYYGLIFVLGTLSLTQGEEDISAKIKEYFKSDIVREFGNQWNVHKRSSEDAMEKTLLRTFGRKKLNAFKRNLVYRNRVNPSFLVTDNVVSVLMRDLKVRDLPTLRSAKVDFRLERNRIKIECGLSKMFIDTDYVLFRNKTSLLYNKVGADVDKYKNSPFSLQQVQPQGNLTIIVENCHIVGSVIATLLGYSVNAGYNTLRLIDCDFSIEIFSEYTKSQPVIAPYFTREQGNTLKLYLSRNVREEMIEVIQSAVFSQINTTDLFGLESLMKYRHHQDKIFRSTAKYFESVIRRMNKKFAGADAALMNFDDFKLNWRDHNFDHEYDTTIKLDQISLSGLDSAFSASLGGPYVALEPRVGEFIKYHRLYVKGKLNINNGASELDVDFGMEVQNIVVSFNEILGETALGRHSVTDYSAMDYLIKPMPMTLFDRKTAEALVRAYFLNNLPKKLGALVMEHYEQAAADNSSALQGNHLEYSTVEPEYIVFPDEVRPSYTDMSIDFNTITKEPPTDELIISDPVNDV